MTTPRQRRTRVIGTEHVEQARARGRVTVEVLPGDIVTTLARETAARLKVALKDGPLAKPVAQRTPGATSAQRILYRRSPRWRVPTTPVRRQAKRIERLALIGAGGVGTHLAQLVARDQSAQSLVLIDLVPGLAESTALDLTHAGGISRSTTRISGSTDLAAVAGADVVVVTAGRPRTPGMTRADLVTVNRRIVRTTGEALRVHVPGAVVIVVTNPLDEMTAEMLDATGFAREQVLGMAGTLDSSRFRAVLADAAGVPVTDVEAITLGSHGDEMVPIVSRARIRGRPLEVFLSADEIARCAERAVRGGGDVVALRKTGSATIAPAYAIAEVLDHLRGARAGAVPVSVALKGEYGLHDIVLGVPCHLGPRGVAGIDEVKLDAGEQTSLETAADAVRKRLADASRASTA